MKIQPNARKAIYIGTLFSIAYLVVYIARNALSAVTPQMLAEGYTEAYIGSISSLYFTCYAVGQLINGFIGDKIKKTFGEKKTILTFYGIQIIVICVKL